MSINNIINIAKIILSSNVVTKPLNYIVDAWVESGTNINSCQTCKHWEHTPNRLGVMDDGASHPYAGLCHNPLYVKDDVIPFTMLAGDACQAHEFK